MSSEESHEKKHTEDAEEIREIFSALNESIPSLITGLIGSVYDPERAVSIARAIGKFYSTLREEGIPEDVALQMTKDYASSFDFSKMMELGGMQGGRRIAVKKKTTGEPG